MTRILLTFGAVLLFAGGYVFADNATNIKLDTCISYYQDGDYQKAVDSLKALLPLISDRREEAEAYKYLGFSFVMLDMINKAKDFFKVALEKFPQMVIDTLEVPPNITIVFRQTKLETQMEKGEIQEKKAQNQQRKVFAAILTSTGALSTGAGGYFFYKGIKAHSNYKNVGFYPGYEQDLDRYWRDMNNDFIIGGCATGVAAVTLYFGLRLFFKKATPSKNVGMIIGPDQIDVVWAF